MEASSLAGLLQDCLQNKDGVGARRLHGHATAAGLHTVPRIGNFLIRLLSLSPDTLLAASSLFCMLPYPALPAWHAIIDAHSRVGQAAIALRLYHSMLLSGLHPSKPIFIIALKACATIPAFIQGCSIHHHVIEHALDSDLFICSTLVHLYGRCSSLTEARTLFDRTGGKTVVSWNAMLAGYVHCCCGNSALDLFAEMQYEKISYNEVSLSLVIKSCGMVGASEDGILIHQLAIERDFNSNQYIASSLVDMYAKCGRLQEAQRIFANLHDRSIVVWNALIAGYAQCGYSNYVIEIFIQMQKDGVACDNSSISNVLKACGNLCAKEQCSLLHALVEESCCVVDAVVVGALVDTYVKCGALEDARSVLSNTCYRSKETWGAMLVGYTQQECGLSALELFEDMQSEGIKADGFIYSCVLKAAGSIRALKEGRLMHHQIVKHGLETCVVVGSAIIDMYNKCGTLDDGFKVFESLTEQDVVSWGAMIAGYVQHSYFHLAIELFIRVQEAHEKPDLIIFACMLKAYGDTKMVHQGECLHDQIMKSEWHADESLRIGLIDLYAKCGCLEEANNVFDRLPVKTPAAWAAIIIGHSQQGSVLLAFEYFSKMEEAAIQPDEAVLACMLKTCRDLGSVRLMHERIRQFGFTSQVGITNSLIDMYWKTGSVDEARRVFDELTCKDIVSWNSMIAGYAEHGLSVSAFELFKKMQSNISNVPDTFTFTCILKACCKARAVSLGNLIYKDLIRKGLEADLVIGKSVHAVYADCGSLEDARKVFDTLTSRDSSSWGMMIAAYAEQSDFRQATECFKEMQKLGVEPDNRVCTGILSAFIRLGEWEQGQEHLKGWMNENAAGSRPVIEHLNCAADLLGRAGYLQEADELLRTMPLQPDVIGWTSLLSAHKLHGSKQAANDFLEEDCQHA